MNNKIASMSRLMGVAIAASALSPLASAANANLAAEPLSSGYTLAHKDTAAQATEHKCGEGLCAAEHKQGHASSASTSQATHEAAKADTEGKCGEGKCGEGKCGADKSAE